jgi:hypothetical protein
LATGGPIFVIGCAGSGSGLLRLALDAHERIAIAPATGFMRAARAHEFIPFWPFGARWHRPLGLSDEQLGELLRGFYDGLFRGFAERQGKQRWGEATPWHLWHVEAIARLFPDAVFAAMVRHPAGAVISGIRRRELEFDAAVSTYAAETTETVRQAALLGDRCALVRFEDLVLDPEPTARALFEWLGEPWPAEGIAGVDRLDRERVSRWTSAVGDWRRERLALRAGGLAERLGYDLEEPRPVERWPGVLLGSALAGAAELAAPPAPLADRPLSPRELELRPCPRAGPCRGGPSGRSRAGCPAGYAASCSAAEKSVSATRAAACPSSSEQKVFANSR